MAYVLAHPRIDAYQLCETAYIMRMDDSGVLHGSPHVQKLVKDHWR